MAHNSLPTQCSHCNGTALYTTKIGANGGYGPFLLPKLGQLFSYAKFDAVLCADCGHYQLFADSETRERVTDTSIWTRLGRA
ncbi:hypothetical protein [Lacipirellula parvula]|uniref:Uncharacterized protein n=1 Tax=Lacipirellula parvula TaxID=2650471 RepID=A0A5K7X6G8_9BACT|nr:hypothetical protein [Lacipirellula parvula]BBO32128.1 hypothetical protein PLANPX_1740 [Lacipirellula parvula]